MVVVVPGRRRWRMRCARCRNERLAAGLPVSWRCVTQRVLRPAAAVAAVPPVATRRLAALSLPVASATSPSCLGCACSGPGRSGGGMGAAPAGGRRWYCRMPPLRYCTVHNCIGVTPSRLPVVRVVMPLAGATVVAPLAVRLSHGAPPTGTGTGRCHQWPWATGRALAHCRTTGSGQLETKQPYFFDLAFKGSCSTSSCHCPGPGPLALPLCGTAACQCHQWVLPSTLPD